MTVVTRFAPSPTGYLHIGGVRTALFSWLYAKQMQGKFILRIEDTDRERSTKESIDAILEGMQWLGLDYDGPYYQTERFNRYHEVIDEFLEKGLAYKCYCSKERLDKLREEQLSKKQKPKYDGHCRDKLNHEENNKLFVVRFKNPENGVVEFDDLIRGKVTVHNSEMDDLIIKRSDGAPTYNFAVVIDDLDMGITDVLRGEDHISNTPRQINIFKALGAKPPKYAHIPMILGADGKRLSKRHGAVSVLQYKEEGFLPEALLNYLVRLGWAHKDQEIFSLEEMIKLFNLSSISRSPASFNPEKLLWLNKYYIKSLPVGYISDQLKWHYNKLSIDYKNGPKVEEVVEILREKEQTLLDMAKNSRYFYENIIKIDGKVFKQYVTEDVIEPMYKLLEAFKVLDGWKKENIKAIISNVLEEFDLKMPVIAQPLRIAVTGNIMSPSIDATLALVGQERTIQRMEHLLKKFEVENTF